MSDHKNWLACPDCDVDAIPSSGFVYVCQGRTEPTWCEDDEANCPECGKRLRANITGDGGEEDYMEAVFVEEYNPKEEP